MSKIFCQNFNTLVDEIRKNEKNVRYCRYIWEEYDKFAKKKSLDIIV